LKQKICIIVWLLATVTIICNIVFVIKDSFFYSLDNLPTGNFVREDKDQAVFFNSGYRLMVYEVPKNKHFEGGIRVEVCNDIKNENKTIYWQTGTTGSMISWVGESNCTAVTINGIYIDFSKETYDCRDFKGQNLGGQNGGPSGISLN
jgi:hypothetical protein